MRIRDLTLILVAPLLLVSCAGVGNLGSVATPQRCEDALANVSTLQDLVKVLINHGIRNEDLQQVATLLTQGQVTIAEVCAYAAASQIPADVPADVSNTITE